MRDIRILKLLHPTWIVCFALAAQPALAGEFVVTVSMAHGRDFAHAATRPGTTRSPARSPPPAR